MSIPEPLPNTPPEDEPAEPKAVSPIAGARARPLLNRRRRAQSHRRLKITAGVLAVLLVLLAIGGGYEAWTLKKHADALQAQLSRDLSRGADHLAAGKAAVAQANSTNDPAHLTTAAAEFDAARASFRSAQKLVATDPVLAQARSIDVSGYPGRYIAPRVEAINSLASMGLALCDAGQDAASVDKSLIKPGNDHLRGGPRLIATLRAAEPFIPKIAADLERANGYAKQVDVTVLPHGQQAAFLKARDQIQNGLDGTKEFQQLEPVLLEILGANGPRTYLVENIDPAELRGGGGFVGSFIMVSADKGEIKLGSSNDVYQIDYPYPVKGQRGYVPPPNSLNEFATHGWVFGDSNFYADFPASARAGQDLFKRETGKSVDGVIGLDFWAVAEMLNVTGPIAVPEYGTTVNAKTFPDEVVHRILTAAANVPGKKTFFPVVAALVLDKLTSLDSAEWTNLLGHLNTAVTQRHLQAYFNRDTAQKEMAVLGWGGEQLAPGAQAPEVVQEVEANYGGNKANYWLQRTYTVDLSADDSGRLTHRFALSLKNQTPPGYEGGQSYRAYFRFYYPASGSGASAGGLFPDKYASDEKPIGLKLLDGWYQIPPYATYDKIEFNYTTQAEDLATGHRIYWEKQAGTLADKVHIVYRVGGKTYTADTDLSQDRVIVLTTSGIKVEPGTTGGAKLPVIG